MNGQELSVNQTICHVVQVDYLLPQAACNRCGHLAAGVTKAARTAIDIHLNHPVLSHVTVSVHFCLACQHYLSWPYFDCILRR